MTTNGDMTPRQRDEDEPIEELLGDVLDLVDKTVARITDTEVDEHLRKVLNQSGYNGQLTDLWGEYDAEPAIDAARPQAEQIVAQAREEADRALEQAAMIVREAREQAKQIISEARSEAAHIVAVARNWQMAPCRANLAIEPPRANLAIEAATIADIDRRITAFAKSLINSMWINADFTSTIYPDGAPFPGGWVRDRSGRLQRINDEPTNPEAKR
jgi:cell division septum initiation protein DivIVA